MNPIRKMFEKFKKPKQYTFVYCPKCNNEMVSNGHAIEDNDGIIKYKCSKCGNITFWDFTHFPVPYLITCANCEYLKMNNDGSAFCDEKDCSPDTLVKHTVYGSTLRKEKPVGTTFDEIIDILDKWQFMLGQRAGRELWVDKPSAVQEEDLANFNRDLETVRSFLLEHSENSCEKDICTCDECKFLKVRNDLHICSKNSIVIFDEFGPNLKEHFCAFGERKE